MDKLLEEAEKANEVLRFVGAVDVKSGKAKNSSEGCMKQHTPSIWGATLW